MVPFQYTVRPDRTLDIDQVWLRANLDTRRSPGLAWATKGARSSVTLHRAVWPDFNQLLLVWAPLGLPLVWSGAFNPRLKRGRDEPSAHAGGWAFDLFGPTLPLGRPAPAGHPVLALAAKAKKLGWIWGGDFSRPDPMHFQHRSSPIP